MIKASAFILILLLTKSAHAQIQVENAMERDRGIGRGNRIRLRTAALETLGQVTGVAIDGDKKTGRLQVSPGTESVSLMDADDNTFPEILRQKELERAKAQGADQAKKQYEARLATEKKAAADQAAAQARSATEKKYQDEKAKEQAVAKAKADEEKKKSDEAKKKVDDAKKREEDAKKKTEQERQDLAKALSDKEKGVQTAQAKIENEKANFNADKDCSKYNGNPPPDTDAYCTGLWKPVKAANQELVAAQQSIGEQQGKIIKNASTQSFDPKRMQACWTYSDDQVAQVVDFAQEGGLDLSKSGTAQCKGATRLCILPRLMCQYVDPIAGTLEIQVPKGSVCGVKPGKDCGMNGEEIRDCVSAAGVFKDGGTVGETFTGYDSKWVKKESGNAAAGAK